MKRPFSPRRPRRGGAPKRGVSRASGPGKYRAERRRVSRSSIQISDRTSTATISERKELRTIDHLSDQTLLAIFDSAATPTSPSNPNRDFRQVVLLTHVSHRWRYILLNCGQIWSDIDIYGQDTHMLGTQIERCGGAPLHVSIKKPSGLVKPSSYSELWKNTQAAANLIRKRGNQVTRLKARLDCSSFQRLLGFEWPNLEEFVWVDNCFNPGAHRSNYNGGLPRLRHLSIKRGPSWPTTAAKNLTTLRLTGPMDLEPTGFAGLLRRNTSLRSLGLTHVNVREPPSCCQEESIELPHLNELRVYDGAGTCRHALALLNLPSLRALSVSSTAEQSFQSDSPWSGFCSRLSITSLEARYNDAAIRVVGSDGSEIRPLEFEEFSYADTGSALFRSLSSPSLSSVTSWSFINNMPEGLMSSPQISAICDLLKHLSRVERMRVCPSRLAVEVSRRLRDDSRLCLGLKDLGVTVTDQTREAVVDNVNEALKARAAGNDGWEMRMITTGPLYAAYLQRGLEPRTQVVWKKVSLGGA